MDANQGRYSSALAGFSYVQWSPVVAGALAAAALSFVFHAFAGAIGLAVSSTDPTWRDASLALWILSGIYLLLVAVAAYGLGGYVSGRMREGLTEAHHYEVEFRDGVHGLIVWALATLLTALIALAAAQGVARFASSDAAPTGSSASAGENLFAYELDKLFRSDRPIADIDYSRDQASRILLTAGGPNGVAAEDRMFLAELVASRAGVPDAAATQRVQDAITRADESIGRARRSSIILAFFAGAAAMVGAAVAWFAAITGGRQRDTGDIPSLRRGRRVDRTASVRRA